MPLLQLDRPKKVFRGIKEAPLLLLLLVLFSDITFNWLYVNFLKEAFSIPGIYTSGVVDSLAILSLMKLAFVGLGVIFWIGRFRPWHLGMGWKDFKTGLLATFFLWSMLQLVQVSYGMLSSTNLGYLNHWQNLGGIQMLSSFVFYAIGKAFFDELVYRGLLLPQLHLKCKRYINLDDRITLSLAVILSQSIYLIIQLPLVSMFLSNSLSSAFTLTSLFFLSILNSLIYLRTRNLYIAIGLHALWYHPVFVAAPSIPHTFILVLLAIGFILIWPMLPNSPSLMSTWPMERRSS